MIGQNISVFLNACDGDITNVPDSSADRLAFACPEICNELNASDSEKSVSVSRK